MFLNQWGLSLGVIPPDFGGTDPEVLADAASPSGYAAGPLVGNLNTMTIDLGSPPDESESFFCSWWMLIPTGLNLDGFCYFKPPGVADYLRIDADPGGSLTFGQDTNSSGNLTLTYGSAGVDPDVFNHYQIEWVRSDSTGILRVRINGNTMPGVPDRTTGDTKAEIGLTPDAARQMTLRASGSDRPLIHSIVAWDSVAGDAFNALWPQPIIIEGGAPDGAGTSDWTGSDADSVDNHLLVDERPADSVDYIESNTATDLQVLTLPDQVNAGTPLAVTAVAYGRDTTAGGQQVKLGVRSSGSDSEADIGLPASDGHIQHTALLDPNGDIAWTETNRNAAELVMEVV